MISKKEEFMLMYSSMILFLKESTDVKIKLFAGLLDRYSDGREFCMSSGLKEIIAKESGCSPRSFDSAFSELLKRRLVVKIANRTYKINPRHVYCKFITFNVILSLLMPLAQFLTYS